MVIQLGEEPLARRARLSTLFDWTILEQVERLSSKTSLPRRSIQGSPCIAVAFADWKSKRVPTSRFELVRRAIDNGILEIEQLPQALHIGGEMRQRQAFHGDLLVTIGGGPGVEQLAVFYRAMHKPVIPLDLPLKPKRKSASERLNAEALEKPSRYLEFEPPKQATGALSNLSIKRRPSVDDFAKRFLNFVTRLRPPQVFLARLLNRKVRSYRRVATFFEQVVAPTMAEAGFSIFDSGRDASEEPFLNVEIFKTIEASSIVIVDLTELRPNCLFELGFAIGLRKKVIITAARDTMLPFDTEAFPCHFWSPKNLDIEKGRTDLRDFMSRNLNRRTID